MASPLCAASDLIARLDGGAAALRELAGDDGAGSYDVDKVTRACAEASEEAYGILLSGFDTVERVQALVTNDPATLNAICQLVRYNLASWKKEFRGPDGLSIFKSEAREARDLLRDKARGSKRTSAEEVTPNGPGQSGLLRPRGTSGTRSIFTDCNGKPVGF